jgi:hypothetical protein
MQIIHRIVINSSMEIKRELAALGIVIADSGLVVFEVDENHSSWPAIIGWIARRQAFHLVSTRFTKRELADARWLELIPDWHYGYPQPHEDVFGYRQATYDLADWCDQCGIGMRQKAPFQMRGEPKWGRRSILQLNWVFDEYFVTPHAWSAVFKPHGIGCRPVMNRKGIELATVVQLVIDEEVGIKTEGLAFECCEKCYRIKYLPVTRGPSPPLNEAPTQAMAKTHEYFGSGASAYKCVIVSQDLAGVLMAEKRRGASFRAVASDSTLSSPRARGPITTDV